MVEFRRVLVDGTPTSTHREGDELVTVDGERIAIAEAIHLAPVEPSKIIAIHLNYGSRVDEFMTPRPTFTSPPLPSTRTWAT